MDADPPARPPPARSPSGRLQAAGCGIAFAGMVALTVTPALGHYVEVGARTAYGVLAVAIGLLVAGAVLGLAGAARGR